MAILVVTVGALAQRAFQHAALESTSAATAAAKPVRATAEPLALEPAPSELPGAQPLAFEPPEPQSVAAVSAPALPAATSPSATRPMRQPPSEAELRAAFNATPIVMYGASWCGVCRQARAFMAENGLRYQEIDADKTAGGWDKVQALSGRKAVPVIVVDGEVSVGLSPERVMTSVAHSMERRLGITGVSFRQNRPNAG